MGGDVQERQPKSSVNETAERQGTASAEHMKGFWVTIRLGRCEIEDGEIDEDILETWLEDKFEHVTCRFEGSGRVKVDLVDPLRADVTVNFTVDGESALDVMERFHSDFEVLAPITRGIDIAETQRFKLCFATIDGEQFPVFVRFDPASDKPLYTED
jgi:hypothetical protein